MMGQPIKIKQLDRRRSDIHGYLRRGEIIDDLISGSIMTISSVGAAALIVFGTNIVTTDEGYKPDYGPQQVNICKEDDEENPLVTVGGLKIMLKFYNTHGAEDSRIEDPAANTRFVHDGLDTKTLGEAGCIAPDGSTPEGFVHLTGGDDTDSWNPKGSAAILELQGSPRLDETGEVHFVSREWDIRPEPSSLPHTV